MKKLTFLIAASVAALLVSQAQAENKPAATPAAATAPSKDYIILKIDGQEIKKSQVESIVKASFGNTFAGGMPPLEAFPPNVQQNILRGIVTERVLSAEAEKEGYDKRPDVQEKLKTARQQVLLQSLVQDKTQLALTDDKLKAEYNKQAKENTGKEELHARHILVKTEAEANALYDQLKKGADFEKLAKEKSEDKGSGAEGGDLGYFTADRMVPEFSKAAFALKKGEISKPVKTDFGWHVIKVEDRRAAKAPTFDEVKEQLRQQLGNKVMEEYALQQVHKSNVKYYGPDGKELPDIMATAPEEAKPSAGK